jgi:hypothetical protein
VQGTAHYRTSQPDSSKVSIKQEILTASPTAIPLENYAPTTPSSSSATSTSSVWLWDAIDEFLYGSSLRAPDQSRISVACPMIWVSEGEPWGVGLRN